MSTDFSVNAIITLKVKRQCCPVCGCSTKRIHDYRKRSLTHAVINDVYTNIIFNQRRYRCTGCDKSFPETNPFAYPNRRVSAYVIQQVNNAFNNIRVRVMKSFETTSEEYQLLKRFNWVLMKNSSRIDLYESIESINARIKVIKQNGNGYRNFERFKLRVLYSLNDNSSIKS